MSTEHQTESSVGQPTEMNGRSLTRLYQRAHDRMRDVDGLLPQEAFDELLKYLFYRDCAESFHGDRRLSVNADRNIGPAQIREAFAVALHSRAPWAQQLWQSATIRLSDRTLEDVQEIFSEIRFDNLPLDVRSTALRTFISADVRKGLGMFLTPEDVVRMMVEVLQPKPTECVLDPACGSGTFLLETARFLADQSGHHLDLYGVDKNPRMLLLADLNLGFHTGINFFRTCTDALRCLGQYPTSPHGLVPNSVDLILTNPPFGVTITEDTGILDLFQDSARFRSNRPAKVPSEILFLKLCLRLLRPNGRMGIVLPRSVLTNERIADHRFEIDQASHLTDIVDLPTETFSSTGTQTTTVAAFFRKNDERSCKSPVSVRVCHVNNVGFDATGRHRQGNQLLQVPTSLSHPSSTAMPTVTSFDNIQPDQTLQSASSLLFRRNGRRLGKSLREYVALANTGRTPNRAHYTPDGAFIIKVGNLTGRGIDWEPRDRNYVSDTEGMRRAMSSKLIVSMGDIVLTSSAHVAKYIAKKVDIVYRIPMNYQNVTFVGEIIRIRPQPDIDPFILLAALRHPSVRDDIQASVRGQTAHLNPLDLLEISMPCELRNPPKHLTKIADLLRQEAKLAFQISTLGLEVSTLLIESANSPLN